MPSRPSLTGRLSPDPIPGTPAHTQAAHNLAVLRDRHARLEQLRERLPAELTDVRCRIRETELRLGYRPTYPAPGPTD